MATSAERVAELKDAANEYFANEKLRLENEYNFLDAISKKRGGSVGLQDANVSGASSILVDSINEFLGRPLQPKGG